MASPKNLLAVLTFLWSHADELAALIQRLPPAMRSAGEGIAAAGDGALRAGSALGGDDAAPANAAEVLKQATEAMRQVQQQVQALAGEVRSAAEALEQVRLPVVTPLKQRFNLRVVGLGEPELVTGLTIGEQSPAALAGIAGRIRSQAVVMEGRLATQLGGAADHLDRMSETLGQAGRSIRSLGDSLKAGGQALAELGSAGSPAAPLPLAPAAAAPPPVAEPV